MTCVAQIAIGKQVDQHQGMSSGTHLAHHDVKMEGGGAHRGNFPLNERLPFLESEPDYLTIFLDRQESFFCEYFKSAIFYKITQVMRRSAFSNDTLELEELPQSRNELLAQEDIEC